MKHGKEKSGKEQGNQYSTYPERLANTRCHKCKRLGRYAMKCPLLTTKQVGAVSVACGDDNDTLFHVNATWGQHIVFTSLIERE